MIDIRDLRNRFIVMYSGVLGLGYDFDIVLQTAKFLDKKLNITLVIRGNGELAPKLKTAIKLLGLENVVLDTRFLSKNELFEFLTSADTFVIPMAHFNCIDSGLPTKLFEYQAYGKPIICVSSGEPARYVKLTNSGIIVKPNDVQGLAQAIIKLYSNKSLAHTLGANGQNFVIEHLTMDKIGDRMYSLFSSFCSTQ